MTKNSGVKKPKRDRLSNLPVELLSYILSLMPTKDAVRTSVLSKDWEYRWTSIYNVDVNDTLSYQGITDKNLFTKKSTREGFVKFLDRIVFSCPSVKRFLLSLSCAYEYEPGRLYAWVDAVSRRNVESLKVLYKYGGIVLPRSLLHNTSLRTLDLDFPCTFKVPSPKSCFPNLKNLTLSRVDFRQSSSRDKMVLAFQHLETLVLKKCKFSNVKMVEVRAPSLTKLARSVQIGGATDCSIKIVSTSLVEFIYDCSGATIPEDIVFTGQRVVFAHLEYEDYMGHRLDTLVKIGTHGGNLLKEFSKLKEFKTTSCFTKAINIPKARASLPICLHHLTLLVVESDFSPGGLLELLNIAPFLKYLDIDLSGQYMPTFHYNSVKHVPVCLKDALEELSFEVGDVYSHSPFAKFLVENGGRLKKVNVSGQAAESHAKRLLTISKSSACLEFVVTAKRCQR